jgi:hypothetical protein
VNPLGLGCTDDVLDRKDAQTGGQHHETPKPVRHQGWASSSAEVPPRQFVSFDQAETA